MLSPLLGFVLGGLLMTAVAWIFSGTAPNRIDRWFRRLQLVSASLYSLGHGGNDAQKTMGIIALILVAHGSLRPDFTGADIPFWVVLACQAAIALGTLFGGWRIVKTMGQKITKLKPVGGFCAETGGAMTLFLATALGIPVSTTHTITGAIIGVGRDAQALGGPLGRGRPDRLGVGADDSLRWLHLDGRVVARASLPVSGASRVRPVAFVRGVVARLTRRGACADRRRALVRDGAESRPAVHRRFRLRRALSAVPAVARRARAFPAAAPAAGQRVGRARVPDCSSPPRRPGCRA